MIEIITIVLALGLTAVSLAMVYFHYRLTKELVIITKSKDLSEVEYLIPGAPIDVPTEVKEEFVSVDDAIRSIGVKDED